jgi:hypothetical protein
MRSEVIEMQTRRGFLTAAVATPFVFVLGREAFAQGPIPAGTTVVLQFDQDLTTKTAKKGDLIPLRVYSDVMVNGKTFIRQDSKATGVVTDVDKPGRFGKRGKLKIRLDSVTDVKGRRIALDPYSSGDRFKAEGPGAAAGGLLILGPVGLVGGAFIKGNHVTIEKGTRIQARVAGEAKTPEPTELSDTNGKEKPVTKVDHNRPVDWPDRNIPGHAP